MKRKRIILLVVLGVLSAAGLAAMQLGQEPKKDAPPAKQAQKTKDKPQEIIPQEPPFNKALNSIDDPASIWVVVNKTRPLQPKNYVPGDLVSVGNGQRMRAEPAQALATMLQAAKAQGLTIRPLSGYRSYNTQVSVYNSEVKTYGQAVADTQSARPGTSEHQTGLTIDVGGGGCGIEDCFGNTAEGKWVAENAYLYGFIIRYLPDKAHITGYRYEPWHIRYIGVELATEMHNTGVQTLEEFFGLPAAPDYVN
jgi:D-alanyl-D-alanine carboxypeptidase